LLREELAKRRKIQETDEKSAACSFKSERRIKIQKKSLWNSEQEILKITDPK